MQISLFYEQIRTSNTYGTPIANISMVINEGVNMHLKSVISELFTVVGSLVGAGSRATHGIRHVLGHHTP